MNNDIATRNGVDTATLFATLDVVKQAPAAAQFQFRAHNEWVDGTHSRSTIADYFGVGEERAHAREFVFDGPVWDGDRDDGPDERRVDRDRPGDRCHDLLRQRATHGDRATP
jgi:hypothetical protein